MRVVLDASAAVAAVVGRNEAREILDALSEATIVLTPDLFAAEVTNALWKYVQHEDLVIEEAAAALESALALVDRMVPVATLAAEVLPEAARYGHPAYDLCYAVAARREAASVLTIDRRLGRLLARMRIPVVAIGKRGSKGS